MSEKKSVIDARTRIKREKDKKEKEEMASLRKSYYNENIEIMNKLAMLVEFYKYRSFEDILNSFVLAERLGNDLFESEKSLEILKNKINIEESKH